MSYLCDDAWCCDSGIYVSFSVDQLKCFTETLSHFSSDCSLSCAFSCYILPALSAPLFETQCSYVEAKLAHFLSWTRDQAGADVGPFFEYPKSEYWAYADYKYIALLFQDQPSMFKVISFLHIYMLRYHFSFEMPLGKKINPTDVFEQ